MIEHKEVISSLRKALAHINDPAYLESIPHFEDLGLPVAGPHLSRGQALQSILRLAIDRLAPEGRGHGALDVISYEVLYQYTLSHRNMAGIALQLGMSERQAYRLLNRAIDALAAELDRIRSEQESRSLESSVMRQTPQDQVRSELERLVNEDVQQVDLIGLLNQVRADIDALAQDLDIAIEIESTVGSLYVMANRVLLRQAMLNLVSHALSGATHERSIRVLAERQHDRAKIRLICNAFPQLSCTDPQSPLSIAQQILEFVHIPYVYQLTPEGEQEIVLELPVADSETVLIVDDNEDLIALFRRYLRAEPFRVYGATSFDQARQMLAEYKPEIVILDVMLPRRDGWELLRTLRLRDEPYHPKVIVCSIINDPELSSLLGADAFLNKPVSQQKLIETIYAVRSART
jgi:chemotaxis family two-component system response regulator PixH